MGQGDRFKKIDGLKREKNGGDFVLESRHLVGLFMLLVVIFGVVFTLGYLLGRSQYDIRRRGGQPLTPCGARLGRPLYLARGVEL
jgi:hypothetical protein